MQRAALPRQFRGSRILREVTNFISTSHMEPTGSRFAAFGGLRLWIGLSNRGAEPHTKGAGHENVRFIGLDVHARRLRWQ